MVKTNFKNTEKIESLASEIGENVYIDIANWHLYLSEAHLAQPLAERVYPMLAENRLQENQVLQILEEMKVSIGGGKQQVSLLNLLPTKSQTALINLLQDFQQENF